MPGHTDSAARAPKRRIAPPADTLPGFLVRVAAAIALVGLAALLWILHDVFLLLFGAILIAVMLNAAAGGIGRILPIGRTLSMMIAGLIISLLIAAAILFFGREASAQAQELVTTLPAAWEGLRQAIGEARFETLSERMIPEGSQIAALMQSVIGIVLGVASGLVLAVIGGLYLAFNPGSYVRGAVRLLPHPARPAARKTFLRAGNALRRWLVAKLLAMLIIGVATYIGLTIIGMPSTIALALIAGILEFIPLAGPILASIPALLIALTVDMQTFWLVLLIYLLIQQLEGNIVTPLVLKSAIEIPPAITLFSLFLLGGLFGPVGVLLGGPLTVLFFVAVRVLWLETALGEQLDDQE